MFCPLQSFLRECEQIDSGTAGQEAFLANDDLGVCYVEYGIWMYNKNCFSSFRDSAIFLSGTFNQHWTFIYVVVGGMPLLL